MLRSGLQKKHAMQRHAQLPHLTWRALGAGTRRMECTGSGHSIKTNFSIARPHLTSRALGAGTRSMGSSWPTVTVPVSSRSCMVPACRNAQPMPGFEHYDCSNNKS